ncbi:glycosyltransferase family 4 protein [Roseateles amylovorans]|uniref:Glycosyltransferase family 4 protein n=1 Tax=Roseateles amylovorans TaxID=2978473 RepID=A0ABY6AXD8_9BURK|nr:glycosyltransferase family 4 protein [Roseateles amylovorans]UXH77637.1 glycosyltransferase family 4 protein [Roseateles amylovorans]
MQTVLIFVPNYFPGYMSGGIARTVLNTVEWLGDEFSFLIVTRDRDLGSDQPYDLPRGKWVPMGRSHVRYLAPDELGLSALADLVNGTPHDILHLNSFFDPIFTIKLLLLMRLGRIQPRRVVMSPRGEFVEGPLRIKYPKKKLYIELSRLAGFYGRNMRWHASSPHEAQGIVKAMRLPGERVRSAIDLPIRDAAAFASESPPQSRLRVVFLSRLTREKNLDGALRILQRVRSEIDFDIIGPQEDPAYWSECDALLKQLPLQVHARYLGPVAPEEVFQCLAGYDVFLFPSHGENYGHVIAESIAVGTRVLISQNTPWRDLATDGVGWDLALADPDAFARVLDELADQPPEARAAVRPAVRQAAAARLSDPVALENNRTLYSTI